MSTDPIFAVASTLVNSNHVNHNHKPYPYSQRTVEELMNFLKLLPPNTPVKKADGTNPVFRYSQDSAGPDSYALVVVE